MRTSKFIASFCLVVAVLFNDIANAEPADDLHAVIISKAKTYMKTHEAELYAAPHVTYEIVSENEEEVVVNVIALNKQTTTRFIPELNRFEKLATVVPEGVSLYFCKTDHTIYKVLGMQ